MKDDVRIGVLVAILVVGLSISALVIYLANKEPVTNETAQFDSVKLSINYTEMVNAFDPHNVTPITNGRLVLMNSRTMTNREMFS